VSEVTLGSSVIEGLLLKYGEDEDEEDEAEQSGGEYRTLKAIQVRMLGPQRHLNFLRHISLAGKRDIHKLLIPLSLSSQPVFFCLVVIFHSFLTVFFFCFLSSVFLF